MKKVFNNMIKACAFLLLAVGAALPINAAEPAAKQPLVYEGGQEIKVGDSIMIHKDTLRYLTGERISTWVYTKPHTIQQVGGKRYPYGILIQGIYSWVYPGSIIPLHPEQPQEELAPIVEEQPKVEQTSIVNVEPVVDTVAVTEQDSVVDTVAVIEQDSVMDQLPVEEDTAVISEPEPQDTILLDITTLTNYGKGNYEIPVSYQMNRFAIGARGGFASTMAGGKNMPIGFDALLDLRYAHYWAKDMNKPALGIMTGLNVGYVQASQSIEFLDQYTAPTVDGDVDYVVSADEVAETDKQIQLEVPVMFSMVTPKGFFLNVGPKIIMPVYSTYEQTITNPNIYAYLPELNGNPIVNEVVMGKVTDEQMNIKGNMADNPYKLLSLALGAELGYEIKFKNGNSLDLGIYADYSVCTLYNNSLGAASKVISVEVPTETSAAVVEVLPISKALANRFAFLDAGLKISYNFDWIK